MEMNVFNLPLKIIKFLKKSIEQADNQKENKIKKEQFQSAIDFALTADDYACSPDYGFTIEKEPSKVQKFSSEYPVFNTFSR